jgi:hypothetical protein
MIRILSPISNDRSYKQIKARTEKMTSPREYEHRLIYNHQRSKERRAGELPPGPVDKLRVKHLDEKTALGQKHRYDSEALRRKIERERMADTRYGNGKGDLEDDKRWRALQKQQEREHKDLSVRQEREMAAAKAKQSIA